MSKQLTKTAAKEYEPPKILGKHRLEAVAAVCPKVTAAQCSHLPGWTGTGSS